MDFKIPVAHSSVCTICVYRYICVYKSALCICTEYNIQDIKNFQKQREMCLYLYTDQDSVL